MRQTLTKLFVAVVVTMVVAGGVGLTASKDCGGRCGGCVIRFSGCDDCSAPSGCEITGFNCADISWECNGEN